MDRWTHGNKGGFRSGEVLESSSPLQEDLTVGHSSDPFLEASPDLTGVPSPRLPPSLHLGKFPTADKTSALTMGIRACSAQQDALPQIKGYQERWGVGEKPAFRKTA